MLSNLSLVAVFFLSVLAMWIGMMILISRETAVKNVLRQDKWGWAALLVGGFMGVIGALVFNSEMVTTWGGLFFGFGALVILPEDITNFLLRKSNLGLVIFTAGMTVAFGAIVAIWPWMVQAFKLLWGHSQWSTFVILLASGLAVLVGAVVFFGPLIWTVIKSRKASRV